MAWFSSTESDPKKLLTVVDRVWPIIVAYSKVSAAASPQPPHPMSALPHPKAAIGDALLEWLTLLAKPATSRTIESNWPELVDELASPATVESLIVQYLLLPYYIPDRDAQIMHMTATGQLDRLAEYEIERVSTIRTAMMAERGERESELNRLGYRTRGE